MTNELEKRPNKCECIYRILIIWQCGLAYHCGIGLSVKLYWEQLITHVENLKQSDTSLKYTIHKKSMPEALKIQMLNAKC